MRKRVLMLLADEYRPDPRVMKEARALSEEGYRVTIISWDRSHSQRSIVDREEGQVLSVRTGAVRGFVSLLLNLPSYIWKCIREGLRQEMDVVHAHDLDTLFAGVIITVLRRVPLVYDAHEHYAAMVAQRVPPFATRVLDWIEESLMSKVDVLIAANEEILNYLLPSTIGPSIVVMNTIDTLDFAENEDNDEGITLFYAGSLEGSRYVKEVIEFVEEMDNISFWVAGEGPLVPFVKKKSERIEKIKFMGYLPHREMLKRMASSDAVVALMNPSNENNRIGTPNKMFEAMALGVLVMASKGTLSGEIVEREGCGITLEWSNENFETALESIRDPDVRRKMGENGRVAVESEYSWSKMRGRLITAYSELLR